MRGIAKRLAFGGKGADKDESPAPERPRGGCEICRWTGYVPYHHVSEDGKRISSAVAFCKCEMGEWRAAIWERIDGDARRGKQYFIDLPPELANKDLVNHTEVAAWNRMVYANLARKMGLGYFNPNPPHNWVDGEGEAPAKKESAGKGAEVKDGTKASAPAPAGNDGEEDIPV